MKTSAAEADEALFEEAARWHIRLRDADTPAEWHDAFLLWLRQDPRHLTAYDESAALWRAMGTEERRDEDAIAALVAEERRAAPGRRLVIAVLALLVGLGLWRGPWLADTLRADHVAWAGQRGSVTLRDGTRIDLNSGTALSFDFTLQARHVHLFRGEAFFDVAHDAALPFILHMPEGSLQVTGTRFNVDLTGNTAEIALVEGSVEVSARDMPEAVATLAPGDQVSLSAATVAPPHAFDEEGLTDWRSGRMVFYRTPLAQVVAELGRHQRGGIVLMNDRAAALPVTGAFSTDDPAAVAQLIAETLGLAVHRLGGALTVIR